MLTPLSGQRDLVLPGRVAELEEIHPEDDVLQLGRGVARRDQRGRDGAGRGARDVLRAEIVLLEDGEGTREANALDPAALANQIAVVPVKLISSHGAPPRARSRRPQCNDSLISPKSLCHRNMLGGNYGRS